MTTRTPIQPRTPLKIDIAPSPLPIPAAGVSGVSYAAVPYDSRPVPTPLWKRAAPWLIGFLVCCAWDRAIWLLVTRAGVPVLQTLEESILWKNLGPTLAAAAHLDAHAIGRAAAALPYLAVYLFGRIWIWIFLAVFFIFRHWGGTDGAMVRQGLRRGVFVFVVPALAGLGAEALKLITHRARPEVHDGWYQFLAWPRASVLDPAFWNTAHLGLASSHAAVAFGGALAAGLLLPRWRVPFFVLAGLCTLSRAAVAAHFVSDAWAGVAIAFGTYALVYAWDRRNNGGVPIVAAR